VGQLGPEFFARDTPTVARELIGCRLCRQLDDGKVLRWELTEVEAYDGHEDKACHASKGITPRNAVMFGPPGFYYVYLCYGVHWMLNVVTGPEDFPAAVLIRGAGPKNGPGRVTKGLHVDGSFNRQPAQRESSLWIETGCPAPENEVEKTPRVGIGYAPEPWLSAPYRFCWRRK